MFLVLPLLNQNTEAEKRVNRKQCKSQKQSLSGRRRQAEKVARDRGVGRQR